MYMQWHDLYFKQDQDTAFVVESESTQDGWLADHEQVSPCKRSIHCSIRCATIALQLQGDKMIRERYIHQLENLRDDLLRLGGMVEHALQLAMRSLETWNMTIASQVLHDDAEIDEARKVAENKVIILLATQQPVAGDLRLVGSVFAIATELERIGDYACGIARRVQSISKQPALVTPPSGLTEMSILSRKMLKSSLDAFLRQDIDLAHSLSSDEEAVDALEAKLRAQLMTLAHNEPQRFEAVINMIDIVHLLERVADRSTNIGERVIYMATNEMEELNP